MPEKVNQKTTGHRSIKALKGYEKVSMDQHQASTRVLTSIDLIISYDSESKFISSSNSVLPTFPGIQREVHVV